MKTFAQTASTKFWQQKLSARSVERGKKEPQKVQNEKKEFSEILKKRR